MGSDAMRYKERKETQLRENSPIARDWVGKGDKFATWFPVFCAIRTSYKIYYVNS